MPTMQATASSSSGPDEEAVASALGEAQRLYDLGCAALREESFDDAAECFSKALEIRVQHYGELALECATTYYKYGCALFDKLQAEADPLCETAQANAGPSSHPEGSAERVDAKGEDKDDEEATKDGDEGEEDKDEEGEGEGEGEEGDLEDAWKMLEFARVIHEKHGCSTIETVDIITKLADVNCYKENYNTCYDDYARALQLLKQLVEPDSRILAELHFRISIAYQLDLQPKEALGYCNLAVSICEARVLRLKHELANVQVQQVNVPGSSASGRHQNGKLEEIVPNSEDLMRSDSHHEKDRKGLVEALVAEIKEIEELLVDLKDKADELREMAAAPSLMEALQAVNPEAAATMKQFVSLATVSTPTASNHPVMGDIITSSTFDAPSLKETSSSSAAVVGRENNMFDTPTLLGNSSSAAVVTHLGVVGRGVKRAEPVAMAAGSDSKAGESRPKKRSLDDLVSGSGFGDTQVGFGGGPAEFTNGSTVKATTSSSAKPSQ